MGLIKGTTVTLTVLSQTGVDAFNAPVFSETQVSVNDVIVGNPTTDDITSANDLYGKKLVYTLGIPKGDTHNWENTKVSFFGKTFRTFGNTIEGIEANVPTRWHKKVMVEAYE